MTHPHLNNAPIREAVFDIRCQLPDECTVASLEQLHDKIKAQYSEKKTRRLIEGSIKIDQSTIGSTTTDFGIDGYQFLTADSLQVVQFRLDGFTFSRLAPYETWEQLRDESKRLWQIFQSGTGAMTVSRVALRYINDLPIPLRAGGWDEWLKAPPSVPEEIQLPVGQFLTRCTFKDVETETDWNIIQAAREGESPAKRSVLLDIDVFKSGHFRDDNSIWETAEILRNIKNRIFFGSITGKALELFQ